MMWYAFYWDISTANHICLESSGNCCLETQSQKLRVVSHLYFMRSHRCQLWSTSMSLSLRPGTSRSFEDEHFRDKHQFGWQFHRRWGRAGLLCPGIPSGCSGCLCRQLFERLCSLLMLILRISRFQSCWLWVKWVNFFLAWTHSVWYDVVCLVCFLLVYWHDIGWKCIWVNDICPESSGICCLETRNRKVGNWELWLLCISWGLTDVNLDLLPSRFPFGQALAEALKTNTSVTSIALGGNSIGVEGVKAISCPGIPSGCSWCLCRQFVERFCSLLMLILCISRFSYLVDCEWSGWIAFCLELILCGMMWYAFYWDIRMILARSASLCQRHLP